MGFITNMAIVDEVVLTSTNTPLPNTNNAASPESTVRPFGQKEKIP